MTDEQNAAAAFAKLDKHEAVCTERYGNIWDALKDIKQTLAADRVANATSAATVHARFNTISNRMWAALAGVCVAAIGGLCIVVFHLLTKTHT